LQHGVPGRFVEHIVEVEAQTEQNLFVSIAIEGTGEVVDCLLEPRSVAPTTETNDVVTNARLYDALRLQVVINGDTLVPQMIFQRTNNWLRIRPPNVRSSTGPDEYSYQAFVLEIEGRLPDNGTADAVLSGEARLCGEALANHKAPAQNFFAELVCDVPVQP
jgi:hypothetical protein